MSPQTFLACFYIKMRKLIKLLLKFSILLAILAALMLVPANYAYKKGLGEGKAEGYLMGRHDGYYKGVFTCPCWEREGNICSLCGIEVDRTNAFELREKR